MPRPERGATRVAIIGLGVIGGSAALKLLQRGVTPTGFDVSAGDRELARAAGIDVRDTLAEAVSDADLVLLAVPLDELAAVAGQAIAACGRHATVIHTASLQRPDATRIPPSVAARVLGTHPLAGRQISGFAGADAELYRGATVYIEDRGDRRVREDAELLWSMAGANRIEYRDAAAHDDLMGAVSHLPQILATALANTLAYANVQHSQLGPGGRGMTRLAASTWSMWGPLLGATPGRTLALLESIETDLREMREAIASGRTSDLAVSWSVARSWALDESGKAP